MDSRSDLVIAVNEVETGIELPKCQQCGCMSETLEQINKSLPILSGEGANPLRNSLPGWVKKMKSIRYSCLGCEHCYAGVAQNAFIAAFPEMENQFALSCEIKTNAAG